jgi:aminoglycoside phosphotransferase family enzyme
LPSASDRPRPLPRGEATTLAAKLAALERPETYPDHPGSIEAIQTHFAWVFLTGSHAYKLKKPVRLKGADLRSLEARERNCREELRVNSRLSPRVYLRVAPLARTEGGFMIDGAGEIVDWLVVMRELPRKRMLDRCIGQGRVELEDVERVTGRLAGFYRTLDAEPLAPERYLEQVRRRLAEAADELQRPEFGLPRSRLAAARADLEAACARQESPLARRAEAGRIVEAHGDLRAEHVWLGPPVEIIDALEFDRSLRVLDMAEEIAMLVLDVTRLGDRDLALALREAYCRAAADPVPPDLFAFYAALRALTRAKVSIWHLDDAGEYPDPEPWQRRSLEFVELASDFAADRR